RPEEAYYRYGLRTVTGSTYLSIYRETLKRYPDRDRRQVLLDLMEARGQRGKWFAAAKDAGFLDIALLCARDFTVEPATLVRAPPLSSAPRVSWLPRSQNSRWKSDYSLCSGYSTAAAMIPGSR